MPGASHTFSTKLWRLVRSSSHSWRARALGVISCHRELLVKSCETGSEDDGSAGQWWKRCHCVACGSHPWRLWAARGLPGGPFGLGDCPWGTVFLVESTHT